MRIAHITDLHLDEELPSINAINTRNRLDHVLRDIKREMITEVVCTGDIGENDGLSYFFAQQKLTSLHLTLGNHDAFREISEYYKIGARYSSEKLYSSEIRDFYKLIFLDSSEGKIDVKQLLWLKKELTSSKPILIFLHHPIMGLGLAVDKIGGLENGREVLSLLAASPQKITVFCGHYHMESEVIHNNITQYITPAVSFQIEKQPNKIEINTAVFGYRIISLEENKIHSKTKFFTDAD